MPFYTPDNYQLVESVGFALNKARNLLSAELDAGLRELGVKAHHIGILMTLKRGTCTTPASLARHLGMDTGLMTRMLDRLETRGLLRRSRDTGDRRVVNLVLTEAGCAAAIRIAEIAPGVLNARLHAFSAAEFDDLRRLLAKFLND
jgi:DNA-binding MarR family transcriptional regulator